MPEWGEAMCPKLPGMLPVIALAACHPFWQRAERVHDSPCEGRVENVDPLLINVADGMPAGELSGSFRIFG